MAKSQIILWLGLMMVVLQIVKDWPVIKATLFTPTAAAGTGTGASGPVGGSGFAGGAVAGAGGSVLQ